MAIYRRGETNGNSKAITKIALSQRSRELNSAVAAAVAAAARPAPRATSFNYRCCGAYFLLRCGHLCLYDVDTAVNVGIELALFLP